MIMTYILQPIIIMYIFNNNGFIQRVGMLSAVHDLYLILYMSISDMTVFWTMLLVCVCGMCHLS